MFTKSEFETESAAIKGQGRSEHVSRTVYNWENMKKAKGKKVTFSTPASQTVIRNEAFLLKKKKSCYLWIGVGPEMLCSCHFLSSHFEITLVNG